tara:strand:+ start:3483 stop:4400 length:918 start_codon:yes stop_codon:yes gene_type:complete
MIKFIKAVINFNLYSLLKIFKLDKYLKNVFGSILFLDSQYKRSLMKMNLYDIFYVIDIETIALCNRGKTSCESYCPVSIINRKNKYMDENLYYKIIDDLSFINFKGSIRPHFYSEPLLDKRLVRFVKYARAKCPNSEILIKSNGDYLSFDKYNELIDAGVNKFKITQYDGYFQKNIVDIYLKLNSDQRKSFQVRVLNSFYENRGMYSREEVEGGWVINEVCNFPIEQMHVTSDGNAVVCPNDFDGAEITLGNVIENSLIDIWQSDYYLNIRKQMQKGDRKILGQLCVGCNHTVDLPTTTNYVHLK